MRKLAFALIAIAGVVLGFAALGEPVKRILIVEVALPSDVHAPILRAAGSGPVDAGKQRILIPVDGVMYEVIVKRPTMPMLIPAGEGRSAPP